MLVPREIGIVEERVACVRLVRLHALRVRRRRGGRLLRELVLLARLLAPCRRTVVLRLRDGGTACGHVRGSVDGRFVVDVVVVVVLDALRLPADAVGLFFVGVIQLAVHEDLVCEVFAPPRGCLAVLQLVRPGLDVGEVHRPHVAVAPVDVGVRQQPHDHVLHHLLRDGEDRQTRHQRLQQLGERELPHPPREDDDDAHAVPVVHTPLHHVDPRHPVDVRVLLHLLVLVLRRRHVLQPVRVLHRVLARRRAAVVHHNEHHNPVVPQRVRLSARQSVHVQRSVGRGTGARGCEPCGVEHLAQGHDVAGPAEGSLVSVVVALDVHVARAGQVAEVADVVAVLVGEPCLRHVAHAVQHEVVLLPVDRVSDQHRVILRPCHVVRLLRPVRPSCLLHPTPAGLPGHLRVHSARDGDGHVVGHGHARGDERRELLRGRVDRVVPVPHHAGQPSADGLEANLLAAVGRAAEGEGRGGRAGSAAAVVADADARVEACGVLLREVALLEDDFVDDDVDEEADEKEDACDAQLPVADLDGSRHFVREHVVSIEQVPLSDDGAHALSPRPSRLSHTHARAHTHSATVPKSKDKYNENNSSSNKKKKTISSFFFTLISHFDFVFFFFFFFLFFFFF
eukprot:Rhum_TRINITY_DN14311_c30_g1::Rhum_TRINITY_DN14311_c30_g1_i1::g.83493::m.83493